MEDAIKTTGEIQNCKSKNGEADKPLFNIPKEDDCSNPNLEILKRDQEAISKAFLVKSLVQLFKQLRDVSI